MVSNPVVIVLTTLPVEQDPTPMATALVGEGLVACINVLPTMQSVYRWQGKIEQADERQVVMKTTAARVSALEERLRQLHPYDVPEFLVLPAGGGSDAYLEWVRTSTEAS
jgi:periplasmic divalent cation tolerance protein